MSKRDKWRKTLTELQITDNERQSVKDIMSRLRGTPQDQSSNSQNLEIPIEQAEAQSEVEIPEPERPSTIDLNKQSRDLGQQLDQESGFEQPQNQPILPITQFTQNPVPIEPRSENAVLIEPRPNRTPSVENYINFREANGYKSLNILDDEIMPTLAANDQIVLRRLYRLSYGFNRQTTDSVTVSTLAKKCNLGESTIKRSLRVLSEKKLIVIHANTTGDHVGNRYSILTEAIQNPVPIEPRPNKTALPQSYIKHDDHDDLNRQDHHQSEHEKVVMMIYQKITGNYWSKADIASYDKIKNIPLESIETAIKLATQRAANRPNSLAYFVKEIINTANPPKQNRSQRKKAMERIVDRVRNSFVGSSYTMFDFTHKVKDLCFKEDITFDTDIFDEILAKKK